MITVQYTFVVLFLHRWLRQYLTVLAAIYNRSPIDPPSFLYIGNRSSSIIFCHFHFPVRGTLLKFNIKRRKHLYCLFYSSFRRDFFFFFYNCVDPFRWCLLRIKPNSFECCEEGSFS